MSNYEKLKELAEATKDWDNLKSCWPEETEDGDLEVNWFVGAVTEDDDKYPVLEVNTAQYDAFEDAGRLARYYAAANPAAVLALIAENERLKTLRSVTERDLAQELEVWRHGPSCWNCGDTGDVHDMVGEWLGQCDCNAAKLIDISSERDQLRAEIAGLKTGYEAYEQVNAELKAEVEGLRDDLDQVEYDANAWRNGEESVWIEVFNIEGDDPFICAISGKITVEQLALIQAEILEYREDYFEKGSGLYVFRCAHCQAHYDNVGMTEPAHWETDFESFSPFPWEEEAAALGQGEQS